MYLFLLTLHTWVRWLVLIALIFTIIRVFIGYTQQKDFTETDNRFRHCTATLFHIQLIVGMLLLVKSPLIALFWNDPTNNLSNLQLFFFNLFHPTMMLLSIVLITIGSAKAKRKNQTIEKHKTVLIWYSVGLFILLLAIPWSFSPFVNRPDFRTF